MTLLLDSDICIAAMKKEPKVLARIRDLEYGHVALPSVVVGELSFGAEKSQVRDLALLKLGSFLKRFSIVSFDYRGAQHYGRIRSMLEKAGTPIGHNDYLIAATALANEYPLLTRNVREFARVPGLRWETI